MKITLFIQCLVDSIYPQVGHAMVQLLEKLNMQVDMPLQQTCCGQPAFNSGYRKEATIAARKFIEIFENADVIVCPSGSCVDMGCLMNIHGMLNRRNSRIKTMHIVEIAATEGEIVPESTKNC